MTRTAVLSDIHANLFAFDAVCDDLRTRDIDEVVLGGDLVGRGPQGDAVVRRVMELGWPSARGNHEDYLLNFHHRRVPESWWEDPVWSASRWMTAELSMESIRFIDALPFSLRAERDRGVLIVHGTPRSNQEGIGSWTPQEDLVEFVDAMLPGEVLACAHTHRPILIEQEGVQIVNTGSVGLPFNGDWRAQYVIVTHDERSREVEFCHVEYDREAFLAYYQRSGFLEAGGITSAMLYKEIEHARPFLVPFLRWADVLGKPLDVKSTEEFVDFYDCDLSMAELFAIFRELGVTDLSGKQEMRTTRETKS